MNSLAVFQNNRIISGFTIVELLLVMTLMFLMGAVTAPVGVSFYKAQVLDEVSENVVDSLRRAQNYSVAGRYDSSFGVRIFPTEYVLFQGDSYVTRVESQDEIFPISESVSISGFSEVVFFKLTGKPSEVGILSFSSGNKIKDIRLTTSGNIER